MDIPKNKNKPKYPVMLDIHDLHPFPAIDIELDKTSCPPISTPQSRGSKRPPHRYDQPWTTCPCMGGNDDVEEIQKNGSVDLELEDE